MIGDRIKALLEEKKISQAELARQCGIKPPSVNQWLSGRSRPDLATISKIATALGVPASALLEDPAEGKEAVVIQMEDGIKRHLPKDKNDMVRIPLLSIEASAGNGIVPEWEGQESLISLSGEWIRHELHRNPDNITAIPVCGESMEPTLRPGEILLVDRTETEVKADAIYVLRVNSSILVKRIQRLPDGTLRVKSDNPSYDPFTIDPKAPPDDLAILGRVVGGTKKY